MARHDCNCGHARRSIPTSRRRPPLPRRTRTAPRVASRSVSARSSASPIRRPDRHLRRVHAAPAPATPAMPAAARRLERAASSRWPLRVLNAVATVTSNSLPAAGAVARHGAVWKDHWERWGVCIPGGTDPQSVGARPSTSSWSAAGLRDASSRHALQSRARGRYCWWRPALIFERACRTRCETGGGSLGSLIGVLRPSRMRAALSRS